MYNRHSVVFPGCSSLLGVTVEGGALVGEHHSTIYEALKSITGSHSGKRTPLVVEYFRSLFGGENNPRKAPYEPTDTHNPIPRWENDSRIIISVFRGLALHMMICSINTSCLSLLFRKTFVAYEKYLLTCSWVLVTQVSTRRDLVSKEHAAHLVAIDCNIADSCVLLIQGYAI